MRMPCGESCAVAGPAQATVKPACQPCYKFHIQGGQKFQFSREQAIPFLQAGRLQGVSRLTPESFVCDQPSKYLLNSFL